MKTVAKLEKKVYALSLRDVASSVTPNLNEEKACKKCKKKVINAFISCKTCDDTYHKSCFQLLVNQGKKCEIITDNEMICYKHEVETQVPLVSVENEIMKLKQENVLSKQEITLLRDELTKVKSTSNRKFDGIYEVFDNADIIKTVITDV